MPQALAHDTTAAIPIDTARQISRNLRLAGLSFGLLLAITLLTLFTPVFDGHVEGVGVGYILGFADFVMVLSIAVVHCRRANRVEREVTR